MNPFSGVYHCGIKGRGAYRNGNTKLPINQNKLTSLSSCVFAIEWGSDRAGDNFETKYKTFERLAASRDSGGQMMHGLRSWGSAALNLCAVAEGCLDGYWEGGCWE